jgi:hypothetical protein
MDVMRRPVPGPIKSLGRETLLQQCSKHIIQFGARLRRSFDRLEFGGPNSCGFPQTEAVA